MIFEVLKRNRFSLIQSLCVLMVSIATLPAFATNLDVTALVKGSGENVVIDSRYDYAIYVPRNYGDDPSKKFPLIVSMPGIKGSVLNLEHNEVLPLSAPIGQKTLEGFHRQFVGNNLNNENYQAIVVSPNCNRKGSQGTCWFNPNRIHELTSDLSKLLLVDPKRIFLTGLSGGGQTSLKAGLNVAPSFYAGVVPIAYKPLSKKALGGDLCKYTKTHIWAWGGAYDPGHNPRDWDIGLRKALISTCGASATKNYRVTTIPNGSHNGQTWDTAYDDTRLHDWFTNTIKLDNEDKISVDAGSNLTVNELANSFSLSGVATVYGMTIDFVEWRQIEGPSVTINNAQNLSVTVDDIVEGNYVFELILSTIEGQTAQDKVNVNVLPQEENRPPEINVVQKHKVYLPREVKTITAEIIDFDGISDIVWSQLSGPDVVLINSSTPEVTLEGLIEGDIELLVTATDVYGLSQSILVNVEVLRSNDAPFNVAKGKPTKATAEQTLPIGIFYASFATDGESKLKSTPWAPGAIFGARHLDIDLMDYYQIRTIIVHSGYNNRKAIKNFSLMGFFGGSWQLLDETVVRDQLDNQTETQIEISPRTNISKIRFICEDPRRDNCRLRELEVLAVNSQ